MDLNTTQKSYGMERSSVTDLELQRTPASRFQSCGSGMFIPDPECFPSQIRIFSIPDHGSASKNLRNFTQFKFSEIWSGLFIPDPHPDFFTHPGSRGQKGTGSRIRYTAGFKTWSLELWIWIYPALDPIGFLPWLCFKAIFKRGKSCMFFHN